MVIDATVTAELDAKDSPLRRIVDDHAALLGQWRQQVADAIKDAPTLRPERTATGGMAGHAIDYRIRWWLTGVDTLEDTVLTGLALCRPATRTELLAAFAPVAGLPAGCLDPKVERAVVEVAVAAATVEPLYRAGAGLPCPLQELGMERFLTEYRDVVEDVLQLSATLPELLAPFEGRKIESGPIVGVGRLGGDGDLLVDNELVEIKCTVRPRDIATTTVRQMLVYAARLRADRATLLLPRQTCRVSFDLTSLATVLERIDRRIVAEYGEAQLL